MKSPSSVASFRHRFSALSGALSIAVAFGGFAGPALAATPAEIAAEISGAEVSAPVGPTGSRVITEIPAGGLLLIPESSNDRVMAFDPETGDLVDADFIPADPDNLSTPIHAILSADGESILVSDQLEDVVQQYSVDDGSYLGVFAPAGGGDVSILDNLRGLALRENGNLLVTVGSGANSDAIAEFDPTGAYVGNFVANGAAGLDSPFDVVSFGDGWLSGGIDSDAIHRFDAVGAPLADFAPIDTFPEQLFVLDGGGVLVANFLGSQEGIVELDAAGAVVGIYDPPSLGGYRGAHELGNGNILTTNGDGVHEIDRTGALVESKIVGVSARFIEFVEPAGPTAPETPVIEVPTLGQGAMAALALLLIAFGVARLRR